LTKHVELFIVAGRITSIMRLLSTIKSFLVPKGHQPRTVQFGLFRGLRLEIDLKSRTQIFLGLWERETYPVIRKASLRCNWAVDIGAGQGELCLFLLERSSAKIIYAFEPQRSEVDLIFRNLELNNKLSGERFIVGTKFVGCSPSADFVSLDSLDLDRQKRGFLKIDVDGAELDVLRSGENLLRSAPMDILLETHSRQLEAECWNYLSDRGFRCEIISKAWWRAVLPELRPIEHNQWIWATKE
jgi:hypothetical protein